MYSCDKQCLIQINVLNVSTVFLHCGTKVQKNFQNLVSPLALKLNGWTQCTLFRCFGNSFAASEMQTNFTLDSMVCLNKQTERKLVDPGDYRRHCVTWVEHPDHRNPDVRHCRRSGLCVQGLIIIITIPKLYGPLGVRTYKLTADLNSTLPKTDVINHPACPRGLRMGSGEASTMSNFILCTVHLI